MMLLAVVALVIPAIYARVTAHQNPQHIESLSLDISYVLIAIPQGTTGGPAYGCGSAFAVSLLSFSILTT